MSKDGKRRGSQKRLFLLPSMGSTRIEIGAVSAVIDPNSLHRPGAGVAACSMIPS